MAARIAGETARTSGVAVVGMSCRLPGAPHPRAFWDVLRAGAETIADAPADRWDPAADGRVPRRGGYLDAVDGFDPAFFGISPKEAAAMDPQQRLALELGWEALEDAGIPATACAGHPVAVLLGAMWDDYATLLRRGGAAPAGPHTITGLHRSLVANRLSYALGLTGPSSVVDSGQSSSLVAVHMACAAIARGDAELALAGGVNLNLAVESLLATGGFGALSPDGRCYTFDARANGYARGEGGGMVVLKRLDAALADGDRIYCVVAGSAVNNDGGGAGLTVPSPAGQEAVLRAAVSRAGTDPADVRYVELHGTGTPAGDPVEAAALGAVLGAATGRAEPLLVGSAKTNVGHLEAAAGVTGLIKAALALHHRELPASLNFADPGPDLDGAGLRVVTATTPWPAGRRVAGVSSFGMGGTNCHLTLTEAPAAAEAAAVAAPPVIPWTITARSATALRAQAAALVTALEGTDAAALDVGFSLATTRAPMEHRLALTGRDRDELLAAARNADEATRAVDGPLAVLFSGQGAQRAGMGRGAHAAFPAYADAFDEVCATFDPHLDRSLRELVLDEPVLDEPGAALLDRTEYTQPALFAVETALFRLAESWGLRPDFLIGHSIGEIVAAHVAGVLSLADACALVAARGRLMGALPAGGAMVAVEAAEATVVPLLTGQVALAAVNSPTSTVVSGAAGAVEEVAGALRAAGVRTSTLRVSHAFHSPLMDPMLAEFAAVAESLTYHEPRLPVISNVTGGPAERLTDPAYWVEHVRAPVRFLDGVRALEDAGVRRFLELGPHGTLCAATRECLRTGTGTDTGTALALPMLRRDRPDDETAVGALATLHAHGVPVDLGAYFAGTGARRTDLPTYAFQRQRYWLPGGEAIPEPVEEPTPRLVALLDGAGDRGTVAHAVRSLVAAELGHPGPAAVDPAVPFRDLGFDSLTLAALRDRLARASGLDLPTGVLFDHPTTAAFADHLYERLAGSASEAAPATVGAVDEPVAIVSMSCRLPGGVDSPEALWAVLADERDVIGGFPTDRGWDLENLFGAAGDAGRSYVDQGGFLPGLPQFAPDFFGISAREAQAMDPQQRVLLEIAWEALERGGIVPADLRGSRSGVYVGAMPQDYGPRMGHAGQDSAGYLLTGTTTSVLSGRIAYTLGWQGPTVTVDTACSSSLVAIHMAVRALRSGECGLALAGGVTVMSDPGIFVELSQQRALSPTGRCRAFSADADGTGWAEGAGMLVLERLSDARANGHHVHAVIRGTAINQDGASNGLTAPNGAAQQQVIRAALGDAGLSAADVDVVEAHGTGTRLGDPIEAGALLATYGADRPEPMWLGSLKSNIGHTQAAAGVAGVIKMVLAMRHATLPRTLHVTEPTREVDWSTGSVRLLTDAEPWTAEDRPRRAAVSSFGISGTNAHAIIEEIDDAPAAPVAGEPAVPDGLAVPLLLSARTEPALRALAGRLGETAPDDLHDLGSALLGTRSSFEERAVLLPGTADDLRSALAGLAAGEPAAGVVRGRGPVRRDPVFVYPGQGSQWPQMAVDLTAAYPVFAGAIDECCQALKPHLDWSLPDVLADRPGAAALERIDVVQCALFAVMVSLTRLWQSHGVRPAATVGHSQGEITAAYVAGAIDLDDAARIVAVRSQAWATLSGKGAMMAVSLPYAEIEPMLADRAATISIAAVNGPSAVTISGDPAALDEVSAELTAREVRHKLIPGVDTAGHSPQVDGLRERVLAGLGTIRPRATDIPFCSTVAGGVLDGTELTSEYWFRNIRSTVRFETSVRALLDAGHSAFLEISPHPMLAPALAETVEHAGADAAVVGTLRREQGDPDAFLGSLGALLAAGVPVDRDRLHGTGRRPVDLPTYPFQRSTYWLQPGTRTVRGETAHLLLGAGTEVAGSGVLVLDGRFDSRAGLGGYRLHGTEILSPGLVVELAVAAADRAGCGAVAELHLGQAVALPESGELQVQVVVEPEDDGRRRTRLHARAGSDAPWTELATAVLAVESAGEPEPGEVPTDGTELVPSAAVEIDERSDALVSARSVPGGAVVELELPDGVEPDGLVLHPALLSAATGVLGVPVEWRGITVHATGARALTVQLTTADDGCFALLGVDAAGRPVVSVDSVRVGPADIGAAGTREDALFTVQWRPAAESAARPASIAWLGADPLEIRPADAVAHADLDAVLAAGAPDVVVTQVPPCPPDGFRAASVRAVALTTLTLVQRWLASPQLDGATLVVLTRGDDLIAGTVWGLIRSVQAEVPGRIRLLDVDASPDAAVLTRAEPQARLRAGRVLVPALTPVATPEPAAPSLDPEGTVLITGGTGGLGAVLARHLVATHGVRHLALVGRRGADAPGAAELAADLTAAGATASVHACDTANRTAVAELLDRIPAEHPLTGVVHAAGVLDNALVGELTPAQLDAVLRPKVDAALHLHELTEALDLPLFVLYSSMTASLGSAGQANYTAANAFLDALARHRRERGLSGTALGWALWTERSTMSAHLSEADVARMARSGLPPLETAHGTALFDTALATGEANLLPLPLDRTALRRRADDPTLSPLLRPLAGTRTRRTAASAAAAPSGTGSALGDQLAQLGPDDQHRMLLDLVRTHAAAVVAAPDPSALDPKRAFKEIGFDSLTAVDLRNRLITAVGIPLPVSLLFDYPAPGVLARYLGTRLLGEQAPAAAPSARPVADDDPIAIVGMSCRLPGGVRSPEDLWELLVEGRDAIDVFPDDRGWRDDLYDPEPGRPGHTYSREGGFLYDAAEFDAAFFGISPREALAMDPQQRVLLETAWEALERGGIDPSELRGRPIGVFVGSNGEEYTTLMRRVPEDLEGYLVTGKAASVASGRISYVLGIEGPAVTVDTACSASLVATHLAVQSLRRGECEMALAGGVTVMAQPSLFVEFSRQRGLARDGRCKSFGDGADGTSWAEGSAVLLLERVSDARRNGHQVLAVLRGSAVNQDGASNGLSAPNGPSQQRVIGAALADAGLTAADVDLVEAHGTGTALGDPIEAHALLATYGQHRAEPVRLGALKSNIGHTQAASGVAGVIKTVLAMRHGCMPATLHAGTPSSQIDWTAGRVSLLAEASDWEADGRPRRAAVSAFGISGTNAHVIVEEAPADAEPERRPEASPVVAWVLSGRTAAARRQQAGRLAEHPLDAAAADVGLALATTRQAFAERAAVLGADAEQLRAALADLAAGRPSPDVVTGTVDEGRTAFLFTGQGAHRAGMGAELHAAHPVFAEAFDEACAALDEHLDRPLVDVIAEGTGLDRTEYAQPALFALQVALFRLVRSWGVQPDQLAGHSVGELAAAHVAGVLDLPDAARLVTARARLMQELPAGGAMVSVRAAVEEVVPLLHDEPAVEVAAVNGPAATVIAGDADGVARVAAVLDGRGVRTKRLAVSHAFHSPLMDPMLDEFRAVAESITYHPPTVPIVSTLTGAPAVGADYWVRHVREAVQFHDAVRTLERLGVTRMLELGPDGVLAAAAPDCVEEPDRLLAVPALRRERFEPRTLLGAVAALHTRGVPVDWAAVFGPATGPVDLPTYAFQHERFWYEPAAEDAPADAEFWALVDGGDPAAFAAALAVDADRPLAELLPALARWRRRGQVRTADRRYREDWIAHQPAPGELTGEWILLVPTDGIAADTVTTTGAALLATGAQVRTVEGVPSELPADVAGVVSLLALDERPCPDLAPLTIGEARTVELARMAADTPLWLVTSGAVVTGRPDDPPVRPVQAAIWGLGRVLGLERPDRDVALVDLPATGGVELLIGLLGAPVVEDQLAVRADGVHVRRLVRAELPSGPAERPLRGTVLITGGLGGLGGHVARGLAEQGAAHLVLTGRRGPATPGADELTAQLQELGARVTVAACDTGDPAALAELVTTVEADGPIDAVLHLAGVVGFGSVAEVPVAQHAEIAAGKVIGAETLDALFADRDLDAFVLFSSIAALWGSGGQGAYAAANARLDAIAHRRRARGLRATAVAWGPWADDGMITGAGVQEHLERHGLVPMDPPTAVAALREALAVDDTCVGIADVDWARFVPAFTAGRARPLLDGLAEAAAAEPDVDTDAAAEVFAQRLAALPAAEQERELVDVICAQAAGVLGFADADAVTPDRPFRDLGFDSLMTVELRDRLAGAIGVRVPTMVIFDHPTPAALAVHLRGELPIPAAADQRTDVAPRLRPADADDVTDRLAAADADEVFAFIEQMEAS